MNKTAAAFVLVVSALPLLASPAVHAQGTAGTPGAPGATTTIDGKQLPPPDPKFGGVIRERATESTPWWAPRVVPPKRAACWPGPAVNGMLIYSGGVTLYLAYLGFADGLAGLLLWPAVVLHVALTGLLASARRPSATACCRTR